MYNLAVQQQENSKDVKVFVFQIIENSTIFGEFLTCKDLKEYSQNLGYMFTEEELEELSKLKNNVKLMVNNKMAEMMDNISKEIKMIEMCNGTCW